MDRNYGCKLKNKRPCLTILIPFITGIIAGKFLMTRFILWHYLLLAVVLLTAAAIAFHSRRLVTLFISTSAFILAVIVTVAALYRHDVQARLAESLAPSTPCSFTAILTEDPLVVGPAFGRKQVSTCNARVRALIESLEIEGKYRPFRARVALRIIIDGDSELRYGDRVECVGTLQPSPPVRNPGSFDHAAWLKQQGIYIQGEVTKPEDIILVEYNCGNRLRHALWSLRRSLRRGLNSGRMRYSSRAFLLGMTIGERYLVSREIREALINTNSMHVLAISGLHIGVLALALISIFRLLPLRRSRKLLLLVFILFVYAALLDFRPPVLRAVIMISAFLISPLLKRESEPVNTLAFAVIAILVFRPLDLFNASFQLSALIVFTLVMLAGPFSRFTVEKLNLAPDKGFLIIGKTKRKVYAFLRYFAVILAVSFAAFIGSAPLVAYYFHLINPMSILSNAIIIPFVGIIVPLGLLSAITGIVSTSAAAAINYLNDYFISGMTLTVRLFSEASFSIMYLKAPSLFHITGFYLLIGLVGFSSSFSTRVKAALVSFLIISMVLIPLSTVVRGVENPRITVFDLGKNNAHFVDMTDGNNVLINTGSDLGKDVHWTIHPFLKNEGINSISAIVLTKLDENHCGGIEYIMDRYKVARVIIPASDESQYAEQLISMLERRDIEIIQVAENTSFCISSDPHISVGTLPKNDIATDAKPVLFTKIGEDGVEVLLWHDLETENLRTVTNGFISGKNLVLVSDSITLGTPESHKTLSDLNPRVLVLKTSRSINEKSTDKNDLLPADTIILPISSCGAVIIDILENDFEIHTMLPYNP